MAALGRQTNWQEFRNVMIKHFGQKRVTIQMQVLLLRYSNFCTLPLSKGTNTFMLLPIFFLPTSTSWHLHSAQAQSPGFVDAIPFPLRSLVKNPTENAHHFLIRVRYVAGLFKEMLTCECPRFTVDVESIARILFLSGLEKWETGKTWITLF